MGEAIAIFDAAFGGLWRTSDRISLSSSEQDGWILVSWQALVSQSQPMAELVVSFSVMS